MPTHRRRRVAAGGTLAGFLLGACLLSWMRPGDAQEAEQTDLVHRPSASKQDLTVRRAPKKPARAAPLVGEPEPVEATEAPAAADGLSLVVVDIVDEEGRPAEDATILPIRCDGFQGGPPGEYMVEPGSCALRAIRRDGVLVARGPITEVSVGGPDPAYIALVLSGRRTGGIGIRFMPATEGMRVLEVVPGSPAFTAGLEAGDVIVAVGGNDVVGMDTDEFVERMTGAEGTDVEFTLGAQSDTGVSEETLRVTRAFLEG